MTAHYSVDLSEWLVPLRRSAPEEGRGDGNLNSSTKCHKVMRVLLIKTAIIKYSLITGQQITRLTLVDKSLAEGRVTTECSLSHHLTSIQDEIAIPF